MKSIPLKQRFWARVDRLGPDKCWEWMGFIGNHGYGAISRGGRGGARVLAHRVSWEIVHGQIPDDLCILHKCDNRSCVNPDHLFLGTKKDNMMDCVDKKRHAFGERVAHARLTLEDVWWIRFTRQICGAALKDIGLVFGVSDSNVSMIISGRRWRSTS